MRVPLTVCGFHLQNAHSTFNLRIPLTVTDSATAQFKHTHVSLFVFGFQKNVLNSANTVAESANFPFLERFLTVQCFMFCLWNPKQQRRSKKCSSVADSATNLIWACCGIRLQCTESTVWPCNGQKQVCRKNKPFD